MTYMTYMKKLTGALALAVAVALGGVANADNFVGAVNGGDGTSWEDPLNWGAGVVPLNGGSGNTFINAEDVVFDANTWAALDAAGNLQGGMGSNQYRVVRLILNENSAGGPYGVGSITFDHGNGNEVLQTNSSSAIFGSRTGQTTVDMLSGTVNTGAATTFGARDGIGILNLSGGEFIVGRGNIVLGNGNGAGTGFVNVTGGTLLTRGGAFINSGSDFEVVGTGSTVGIGSQGTVDGFWDQAAGGILRSGIDSTGITSILITDAFNDADPDGNGGPLLPDGIDDDDPSVTFAAGSILDPYDAGGVMDNFWYTVMEWEGESPTVTGAPTLSSTAVADGWIQRFDGNTLQVQLVSVVPEPSSLALLGLGGLVFAGRRRRS